MGSTGDTITSRMLNTIWHEGFIRKIHWTETCTYVTLSWLGARLLFARSYGSFSKCCKAWLSTCRMTTLVSLFVIFRHFLFKTSSGTTPLFSSSSPGYPLTSGTVYSPPPRLLPRNTFSRSAFKLKKPSKYCSWKCAAVTAIAAAALLAILLSYFIGKWMNTQVLVM